MSIGVCACSTGVVLAVAMQHQTHPEFAVSVRVSVRKLVCDHQKLATYFSHTQSTHTPPTLHALHTSPKQQNMMECTAHEL